MVFPGGEGVVLAFLKETALGVLCFYAPCSHRSRVSLCNQAGIEVASYCDHHARQALREYGAALEERFGERESA